MVPEQKIRNFGFTIKKQLKRSAAIGFLTDLVGMHTSRVGRVNNVISARKFDNSSDYGIQYHLIRNNPAITRPKPQTLEETIHSAFEYSSSCEASEYYMLDIRDAYILTENGWVLTGDREFLADSLFKPEAVNTKGVNERVLWPRVEYINNKLVLASNNWSANNYYHWMLEFLPKISAILDPSDDSFSDLIAGARILLPSKLSPAMSQSLEILGITDDQLFHSSSGQLQVKQLLFVPSYGKLYSLPKWALDWLRNRFSSYMNISGLESKRIYITRRKAATRHVQNEDQVLQMLSRYGFRDVVLEDMSLADQIALFSQAEVIVGPHGAGFSNLVFSTGATLIDIFEPKHVNACFYSLCYDSGQYYWYLMAETVDDVNMHVDVDKLERTLELALQERSGSNLSGRGSNL